jgi:hypothetical protein
LRQFAGGVPVFYGVVLYGTNMEAREGRGLGARKTTLSHSLAASRHRR